jgi:Tfp pilus assembly protein PilN
MKPLAIDFAPRRALPQRTGWLAGGAGVLLAAVSSLAWLPALPVEAGHMVEAISQRLPNTTEAQAVDAAVQSLNLPWLATLDALAEVFGENRDALLLHMESDAPHAVIRLNGAARNGDAVQALPAKLRAAAPFVEATLLSQDVQDSSGVWPVHFAIELRLRGNA